jgi:hypothetical protein
MLMEHKLYNKVTDHYFKNDQWLNFESLYEDDKKSNDQLVCLIDKKKDTCIFCVEIRNFNYLHPTEFSHSPYLIFQPDYNTFVITIPSFKYLTAEDISKAIKYVVHENFWICLNIKIDKTHI